MALDEDFADLTRGIEAHRSPQQPRISARVHGDEYLETLTHQEPQDDSLLDADTFAKGSPRASRRAAGGAVMAVDRVMTGQS